MNKKPPCGYTTLGGYFYEEANYYFNWNIIFC